MATSQMNKTITHTKRPRQSPRQSPEEMRQLSLFQLGLALVLAVVSYWPALGFGFVYDDTQQIVENPALRSWSYLPQYFTANVWAGVFSGGGGSYYRPLFLLWLRLNYLMFKVAPWGWHLTSLIAHLAATAMLFLLMRKWTGDGVVAGSGALLFAVHPIHIEAVAWVSAVPEVLFSVAGLAAIYCYIRYRHENRRTLLLAAGMLYGIALFTKETAIVVWPMIVACDWWLERASRPRVRSAHLLATVKMQVPFAVVTAVYVGLRLYALRGLVGAKVTSTVGGVLRVAPSLFWFYLGKLVIPFGLSPIYSGPRIDSIGFDSVLFASDRRLRGGSRAYSLGLEVESGGTPRIVDGPPSFPTADCSVGIPTARSRARPLFVPALRRIVHAVCVGAAEGHPWNEGALAR